MKTFSMIGLAGLMCIAAPSYAADTNIPNTSSVSGLLGSYTLIGGAKDGQQLPPERVQGSTVRITENTITTFDKDKKETYAVNYTIDTHQKPWKVTITSTVAPVKGEVAQGLIQKDGDTVKLIYAVRGGTAPDDFTTEQN